METLPKIYLTGALVLNMAMTNYCYNTYGLSPDYNFFKTAPDAVPVAAAPSFKVPFLSDYVGTTYDNVVSSMAIIDETVSAGALYSEYRAGLDKKIYAGGVRVQVPCGTEMLNSALELKVKYDYAGDDNAGEIYTNGEPAAAVRIKNGMIYRISSIDDKFKIDGIGVGTELTEVLQKWGQPVAQENDRIFYYNVDTKATITIITSWEGYVTWILYEGLKTEVIDDGSDTTVAEIIQDMPETPPDRIFPIAEQVLEEHRQRSKEK